VQALHEFLDEIQAVRVFRHDNQYDVQAKVIHRVEIENATELDKGHQAFVLDVLVEFALDLSFPGDRSAIPPDSYAGDVQVVKINVENIGHAYKRRIGNSVDKMLVISRTRTCETGRKYRYVMLGKAEQTQCILTHRDVMGLLVLALLVTTWCLASIATGWHASTAKALLLVQITFFVLAVPTLTLALRLPPSVFLGEYITTKSANLLLKCIFLVLTIEAILLFFIFI
jgi:hypothetical protein